MPSPPKLLQRLFRWFCNPRIHSGIEGDLLELFDENLEKYGPSKAKRLFVFDVLRLLRPTLMRTLEGDFRLNYFGLLKHNFIISFRIIRRDKLYTLLNVGGLSLGIATFLSMMLYVQYEESFDQFHTNKDRIYRIVSDYTIDDMDRRYLASSPPRIAPFAAEKIPEITHQIRIHDYYSSDNSDLTFAVGDKKFREHRVIFSSSDFFKLFSFKLIRGNPSDCLDQIGSVVLTKSTAKRYFGDQDPMGQYITLDGIKDFHFINGVIEDPPINSHFQFDILMSYETLNWWYEGEAETHWTEHDYYSFLLLDKNADANLVSDKINQYYLEERKAYNDAKNFDHRFALQSLNDIHLTSDLERESVNTTTSSRVLVKAIYFLGWLILLIAWVNYVNLSTARSNRRLAELRTRKTLGAKNRQLGVMLLIDAFYIHLAAILSSLTLLIVFKKPIAGLLGADLSFTSISKLLTSSEIIPLIALTVGFIACYPLFLRTTVYFKRSINPVRNTPTQTIWHYRILTIFQFAVSIALIIGTIAIYLQLNLIKNKELGFEQYNKLVIRGANLTSEDSYEEYLSKNKVFKEKLLALSSVKQVTTADRIPGSKKGDMATIKLQGDTQSEGQSMELVGVGENYFETLHINLISGIPLEEAHMKGIPVVLNTSALKALGFEHAEDVLMKKLISNDKYELIAVGVIEDYHQVSAAHSIDPSIYYLEEGFIYHYIVDFQAGSSQELMNQAELAMKTLFPRDPCDFYFLDQQFNLQHAGNERLGKIILTFSLLAVIIACLGLIGLSSHNALRRVKEIGIRKTFGAGMTQILLLLNKETAWLLLGANFLAWPVVYWILRRYLSDFATRISLGPTLFISGSLLLALIAVFAVSFISINAAKANPVDSLRSE